MSSTPQQRRGSAVCEGSASLTTANWGVRALEENKVAELNCDVAAARPSRGARILESGVGLVVTNTTNHERKLKMHKEAAPPSLASSTVTSSAAAGIGYLSGKMFKQTGTKVLEIVEDIKIRRRQRIIKQLARQIQALERDDSALTRWLVRKEHKLNRALDDILELSSEHYKERFQKDAIKHGSIIQRVLTSSGVSGSRAAEIRRSIEIKLFQLPVPSSSDSVPSSSPVTASSEAQNGPEALEVYPQIEKSDLERKIRFRQRLHARWACDVADHTFCFANRKGAHVPLNEEAMESWTSALEKGEATLLVPPRNISPQFEFSDQSDAVSIISTTSYSTIPYQRPFRIQMNPSLTDLRSMRFRLQKSMSSLDTSSSASSGEPGIGFLPGKAIKWVGLQVLNGVDSVEINRRSWVIGRLLKKMGRLSADEWEKWLLKNEVKVRRSVEDLLELSLEHYSNKRQTEAIKRGTRFRDFISNSPVSGTSAGTAQDLIVFKLFPLYLLSVSDSTPSTRFADDIREIILQDANSADDRLLQCEFVAQLCHELAYGPPSDWRYLGYATLWRLVRTRLGMQMLEDLNGQGNLIQDLAKNAFDDPIESIVEQATAVKFFAIFADTVPTFRDRIFSPGGLPLLVQRIKDLSAKVDEHDMWTIERLCSALAENVQFSWCMASLAKMDLCTYLVQVLIHLSTCQDDMQLIAWAAYSNVLTIRNIAMLGGEDGVQVVRHAITDELQQILPDIEKKVRDQLGNAMADDFQNYVKETLS